MQLPYSCPVRQELEKNYGALITRLFHSTELLLCHLGVNSTRSFAMRCELTEIRACVSQSRYELRVHCAEHGC